MFNTKTLITTIAAGALLQGCASAPKNIDLPQSKQSYSKASVDGSAIAFQANDGACNKSSFEISQKMSDGKYGPSELISITSSTFKLKSKSLKQDKYASSRSQLYVRPMPPGDYVITRIRCIKSSGDKTYVYKTNPERIDIFGAFTVEQGKTNYIGGLTVSKAYSGGAPSFSVTDKSTTAKTFFAANYADKVGPMQVRLAKRTVGSEAQDLLELFKAMK